MAKKDTLFRLIKSMDRSEKGYFKKYASMYSGNRSQNYIRLFEEIDKQKTYDEKKLKEKFKGEKLLNNFSVAKNYLTDNILRALKGYKVADNTRQEITGLISNARILFKKGLFEERQSLLAKARELALHAEEFNLMISVIGEEVLSNIHNPFKGDMSKIDELLKERRGIYQKMDNLDQILILYYSIFAMRVKSKILDPINLEELEELLRHPVLQNEEACLSLHAKGYFFLSWQYYYEFKEKRDEALQYARKYLRLLQENPEFTKRRDAQNQIFGLYNYLHRCRDAGHYEDFPSVLEALGRIQPKYFALKVFLFETRTENELIYIIHGHQFDLFEETLNRIIEGHEQYKSNIRNHSRQEHFYYITIIHMIRGGFDEALEWNLKTIDLSKAGGIRPDIEMSSRLLNLVIHLELGNTYYLGNTTRTLKRFIKKNTKTLPLEQVILKFIDRLASAPDKAGFEKLLIKMFSEVENTLASTHSNDHTLNHFDIKTWMESKLKNCTMREIYSGKKT